MTENVWLLYLSNVGFFITHKPIAITLLYFFPTSIILIFLFLIVMAVIPEEIVKLYAKGLFTTVNIRGEVFFGYEIHYFT